MRLNPDPEALLADPEAFRGLLFRVEGTLEQRTPLDGAFAEVEEWFVRDEQERPLLLYVDVTGPASIEEGLVAPGRSLAVYARFYKRIDAVARDQTVHRYPAFVGANPWWTDDSPRASDRAAPRSISPSWSWCWRRCSPSSSFSRGDRGPGRDGRTPRGHRVPATAVFWTTAGHCPMIRRTPSRS